MQFIKSPSQAEQEALGTRNWTAPRTYFGVTYAPDGSNWAAGVAEAQPGETVISAGEYTAIFEANKALLVAAAKDDKERDPEERDAFLAVVDAQDGVGMALATSVAADAPPPTASEFDVARARAWMDAPLDRPGIALEAGLDAEPGFETGAKVE
ncbi:MAG: hypothetical protein IT360_09570 [Gemmatimonadaceae bacterium]|nr:hypothetical protein [Gemmatimonadaceae bacterium]